MATHEPPFWPPIPLHCCSTHRPIGSSNRLVLGTIPFYNGMNGMKTLLFYCDLWRSVSTVHHSRKRPERLGSVEVLSRIFSPLARPLYCDSARGQVMLKEEVRSHACVGSSESKAKYNRRANDGQHTHPAAASNTKFIELSRLFLLAASAAPLR